MSPREEQQPAPDADELARSMLLLYGAHDDEPAAPSGGNPTPRNEQPDPRRSAALREATQRDRERYLTTGLQPVDCRFCHVSVQVKKLGPSHTSVQWTTDAVQRCAYFAEVRGAGGDAAPVRTCPRLADSIDHAIAEGILEAVCSTPPPGDG